MKKLLITVIFLFFLFQVGFSQDDNDCPPGAWCHPLGSGMEPNRLDTDLATKIGNALSEDPCKDQDYATQIYCYMGKALADNLPCLYPANSPQGKLCDNGGGNTGNNPGGNNPNEPNEPNEPNPPKDPKPDPKPEDLKMNTKFRPAFFTDIDKRNIIKAYQKVNRGDVIVRLNKGYYITLGYKVFTDKGKSDFFILLRLYDNENRLLDYPALFSRNSKIYLYDFVVR